MNAEWSMLIWEIFRVRIEKQLDVNDKYTYIARMPTKKKIE